MAFVGNNKNADKSSTKSLTWNPQIFLDKNARDALEKAYYDPDGASSVKAMAAAKKLEKAAKNNKNKTKSGKGSSLASGSGIVAAASVGAMAGALAAQKVQESPATENDLPAGLDSLPIEVQKRILDSMAEASQTKEKSKYSPNIYKESVNPRGVITPVAAIPDKYLPGVSGVGTDSGTGVYSELRYNMSFKGITSDDYNLLKKYYGGDEAKARDAVLRYDRDTLRGYVDTQKDVVEYSGGEFSGAGNSDIEDYLNNPGEMNSQEDYMRFNGALQLYMSGVLKDALIDSTQKVIDNKKSKFNDMKKNYQDYLAGESEYSRRKDEVINEWARKEDEIRSQDYTVYDPEDKVTWTIDQLNVENRRETQREFDMLKRASENYLMDLESEAINIGNKIEGLEDKIKFQKEIYVISKLADIGAIVLAPEVSFGKFLAKTIGKGILNGAKEVGTQIVVDSLESNGVDTSEKNSLRELFNPSIPDIVNDEIEIRNLNRDLQAINDAVHYMEEQHRIYQDMFNGKYTEQYNDPS